jgi:hypothetical protein
MSAARSSLAPLPPHHLYRDFLDPAEEAMLLDWALANRARFKLATLAGGNVDLQRRAAECLTDLGPAAAVLSDKIRGLMPDMLARTETRPFNLEYIELELVAHGHGAHFGTHTDMPLGWGRSPLGGDSTGTQDRLLSAVYYFHREPKGFSGGQLRLHRSTPDDDNSDPEPVRTAADQIDIEPERNSLLVFPSWASHEVLRVNCPSGHFEDHRFAVNIWLCATLPRSH